jgi:hypothetical protein
MALFSLAPRQTLESGLGIRGRNLISILSEIEEYSHRVRSEELTQKSILRRL